MQSLKIQPLTSFLAMQKIKAILFDLDNTLADFIYMKQKSVRAASKAMVAAGLQMNQKEAYERLLNSYFIFGIESNDAFTKFLESTGEFNHKILATAINAYLEAKNKALKPYPNVKSTLNYLSRKGIFLSIVTDAPKTKAYQRLLAMGLEGYFKFVVGYEDTNHLKKTGLPLTLALEMLRKEFPDLENSEVLMVGDSMERDIVPAKQLGLKTALSRYGQKIVEVGNPDFELNEFKDLLCIL
jgi:putative hydrolase of the HAD superfamily